MFKIRETDLILNEIKIYFNFWDGYRVKAICRYALDTRVRVFDFPISKLHILDLPYDAVACSRCGIMKKFYISPSLFSKIVFEGRK